MRTKPKLKLVTNAASGPAASGASRSSVSLNRLDWYAAALVCAVIVLAPLAAGDFATPAEPPLDVSLAASIFAVGTPLILIIVSLAALAWVWREWRHPISVGAVTGLTPAAAMLAVWAALSMFRSPATYLSVNALAVLCSALLCGLLISRLARDRTALMAIVISVVGAASIVACVGIREYLGFLVVHVAEHRCFSTFSDPNFLAGYLLLAVPLSLALYVAAVDTWLRGFAGASLVLQSGCLWLSGSRAGSAIIVISICVFLCLSFFSGAGRRNRKRIVAALGLFVIGSLPAATPLLSRLHAQPAPSAANAPQRAGQPSADAQVNSNEFRKWTWIGTVRLAKANPVMGAGIGGFELAYPRFAETAFTAHAHNSYLQLMAETGYPGALFAVLGLAAAGAYCAYALALQKQRSREAEGQLESEREVFHSLVGSPEILLAGLMAAVAGSMLHNLIDSDWYVAANLITLCAAAAIAVALARDLAPLSAHRPGPLHKSLLAGCALLGALLMVRAVELSISRRNEALGQTDITLLSLGQGAGDDPRQLLSQASQEFAVAAAADPLDPEPHLGMAEAATSPEERLRELHAAVSICRAGKEYYRLGQYYAANSDWAPAIDSFEHARQLEPKMLQNLRALAGAYRSAGKPGDARRILLQMTGLQFTPYGEVRAMRESVETDFAFAHAMLGDIAMQGSDLKGADAEYTAAKQVLAEYWKGRNYLVNKEVRTDAKRKDIADLYENVLQQLREADGKLGDAAGAAAAAAELDAVRKDRTADEAADSQQN